MMKSRQFKSCALGVLALALSCTMHENASATAACDFTITSVLVNNNGVVSAYTTSLGTTTSKTFSGICSLSANYTVTVYGGATGTGLPPNTLTFTPDGCKGIYSGLLTAKYANSPVKIYLYDLSDCTTAADITNANNPYAFRY